MGWGSLCHHLCQQPPPRIRVVHHHLKLEGEDKEKTQLEGESTLCRRGYFGDLLISTFSGLEGEQVHDPLAPRGSDLLALNGNVKCVCGGGGVRGISPAGQHLQHGHNRLKVEI